MNEYDVSFYSTPDGSIAIDIHSASGMSPYLRFRSHDEVHEFFQAIGMGDEKLKEVDTICSTLKKGEGFHEKMFLPDDVMTTVQAKDNHAY